MVCVPLFSDFFSPHSTFGTQVQINPFWPIAYISFAPGLFSECSFKLAGYVKAEIWFEISY